MALSPSFRAALTLTIACITVASLTGAAAARADRPARTAAHRQCPRPAAKANFYAPGKGKTVALTFDDGPGASTGQILKILRQFKVPATFFNIGENEAARKPLVREEIKDGFVVGNHTWDHPDMDLLSPSAQAAELDKTSAEQHRITHTWPCVFRPPYGDYDTQLLRLARRHRLQVWLWSVDTQDWMADGSGAQYWVNRIISLAESEGGVQQHPVVLMHNQPAGNPATVSALPTIIRFFRSHHYRFVALQPDASSH
jgi:peptidoglycan/xylan/chitin deacetylase (PgdA/CDA1 family)